MAEIPTADWSRINAAADRFERAWRAGSRPRIEDYLAEAEPELRAALLEELLRVERELRRRDGEDPGLEEYSLRFSQHAELIQAVFGPGPDRPDTEGQPAGSATTAPLPASDQPGDNGDLPPGTFIRYFGDYEIRAEIGRGGMGVVYKARQISLNRPVALKMIRSAALASDDEIRRFRNEAEAVARLDHPHIVSVYEVGEHDGRRYFSMKLIAGPSLHEALGPFKSDPRAAARLMVTVAEAVHHAHQRGILHRDLKPSNILLDDRGRPHITDFGLARRLEGDEAMTLSGAVLGTPAYMAPEQAGGHKRLVTTLSDVYGLGAVLYALLTGVAPYRGETPLETLDRVRREPVVPPSRANSKVPRDLEVICLKCLEKDPERRYASAQAVAEDLSRYLAGQPIAARATGPMERAWLWCRRNPRLAGAAGTTAAALVAVAAIAVAYGVEQARARRRIDGLLTEQKGLNETVQQQSGQLKLALDRSNRLAGDLKDSYREAERRLAAVEFERAQVEFAKKQVDRGMLRLVQTWRGAVKAEDPGWQHMARASLSVWSRHQRSVVRVFDGDQAAFSADGKTLLVAGDGAARLWDVATGRAIGPALQLHDRILRVVLGPRGALALTEDGNKTARLWDVATGRTIGQPMVHPARIQDAFFGPDGKTVLTWCWETRTRTGDAGGFEEFGELRFWEPATARPIGSPRTLNERVNDVLFSPDGRVVVTTSHSSGAHTQYATRWWDATTGTPIGTPLIEPSGPGVLTFTPDGRFVLQGIRNVVKRWDAATASPAGAPVSLETQGLISAFSPDARLALAALQLCDVATGKVVGPRMQIDGAGRRVKFSADGRSLLTHGSDGALRLFDVITGQSLERPIRLEGPVTWVAYSPDGRTILTIGLGIRSPNGRTDVRGGPGGVRLWDADPRSPLGLPLETQGVISGPGRFVLSSDGRSVLGLDWLGKPAQLWDIETSRARWTPLEDRGAVAMMPRHGPRSTPTFSRDGKTFWTEGQFGSQLWELATGKPLGPALTREVRVSAAAFSPDGRVVLMAIGDGSARLWDRVTGHPIGLPLRHPKAIWTVAFSPDGRLALTGGEDKTARLWDIATGRPAGMPMVHQGEVLAVAFSPDGRTVLTGSSDGTARRWNVADGQPIGGPLKHQDRVSSVAFSPDGLTILTGSFDGTAGLWEAATGQPIGALMRHGGKVYSVAFSPDGQFALTGSADHTARLWDAATGMPSGQPFEHEGDVLSVAFSPDGRRIAVGGETTRLWDPITHQPVGPPITAETRKFPDGRGLTVVGATLAFSPDGPVLLVGSSGGGIGLRDASTGRPLAVPLPRWNQMHAEMERSSPDGRILLTYQFGDKAQLLDAATREPIGEPLMLRYRVGWVAFSPDSRSILFTEENVARLWDTSTGKPLGIPMAHSGSITGAVYSPDGRTVLTASYDRTARLWDAKSGQPIGVLMRHEGGVEDVAFSPDGRSILTASGQEAQLWDAATGQRLGPPMGPGGRLEWVAFSPDSRTALLTTGMGPGGAGLWDVAELPDDLPRVATWVEMTTGLRIDDQGEFRVLDHAAWRERVDRLASLGGPPPPPRYMLDPVHFDGVPTARVRFFQERGRMDEAKAAFDELVHDRPYSGTIRMQRGQFLAGRGLMSLADADFVEAYALGLRDQKLLDLVTETESRFRLACTRAPEGAAKLADRKARRDSNLPYWGGRGEVVKGPGLPRWGPAAAAYSVAVAYSPDDPQWHDRLILSLLAAGDDGGARRARAETIRRLGATADKSNALAVAWSAALVPRGFDPTDPPVFLVERALKENTGSYGFRTYLPVVYGAELYRAGRHAEAIDKLMIPEQRRGKGAERISAADALAWPFLAMAHQRRGHREEARRWLERFRRYQPDPADAARRAQDPDAFWEDLEFQLLRSEAEAVVLYDPVFPADPFAH
jgi:WD40 repeat protein/tRNA A-37 threonylcarbamoyl transferase component Bud32/tetratricopeptide (TPR) repeat protein